MIRKPVADIQAGRLSAAQLAEHFGDVAPALSAQAAVLAAQRCLYCYDAPCIQACPTGIDIPSFIRRISTGNLRGAATDILSANILGGACARVCPTEILCEGACVRHHDEGKPVEIGALQRHATDWVYASGEQLFTRAADTGKHVAVVGAGPAGLACAHALALLGHRVSIYEAQDKPGGLNEYGIAAYKVPGFAQVEIDWLLGIGGIEIHTGQSLGENLQLQELKAQHDAVFLGLGLSAVNALGLPDEHADGVRDAVEFIAQLRQTDDLRELPVGRRVVVIGGGNTAIDAAIQSKRLGAEQVTLVYRRGPEQMSATSHEQAFAKEEGVTLIHWAQPKALRLTEGQVSSIEFEYTELDANGRLRGSGDTFELAADWVLKAIGQALRAPLDGETLKRHNGRIQIDEQHRTSIPGIWAGGDCTGGKTDLTVQAVEDGKRAAASIAAALALV